MSTDGPLILVVDDYDDAREMYRDYLEFAGFRVETARDGREAIEKARALQPDLILMDLSLPVVDGWEATRRLKANAALQHIPIIALTAHAMTGDEAKARAAGCDDYLSKPIDEDLLFEKLRHFLEDSGSDEE